MLGIVFSTSPLLPNRVCIFEHQMKMKNVILGDIINDTSHQFINSYLADVIFTSKLRHETCIRSNPKTIRFSAQASLGGVIKTSLGNKPRDVGQIRSDYQSTALLNTLYH